MKNTKNMELEPITEKDPRTESYFFDTGYKEMKVETSTLLFAVVNLFIWVVKMLWLLGLAVLVITETITITLFDSSTNQIVWGIAFGFCAVNFVFGIILWYGVTKKNPSHINAFFVFGVVLVILITSSALFYLVLYRDILPAMVTTSTLFVYCPILWMVNETCKKFSNPPEYSNILWNTDSEEDNSDVKVAKTLPIQDFYSPIKK